MRKNFIAGCCVFFGLLMPVMLAVPEPARAQGVTLDIRIGSSLNHGRWISCGDGERLLRDRGYRQVRRVDCRGRRYVYHARRGSHRYEITLNSHNGRVVNVRRMRR